MLGYVSVTFVATLNAVWIALGALALGAAVHTVLIRKNTERKSPGWLFVVGVGLIVAALFPYISATDDVLRIDHDQTQRSSGHGQKHPTDNLMRLYEAMETSVVCHSQPVVVSFTFVAFVLPLIFRCLVRVAPASAGRSPPPLLISALA